jgi:DnaD/phage-associated family protein
MSISIISLVFAYRMPQLKTKKGTTVPDSTAKFVLLALADHCNDQGASAYPSIDTLCSKTNMARSTVCNALNALKINGYIRLDGRSKWQTKNYSINKEILLINPTAEPVQPSNSLESSHRTDVNPAAELKPSINHSINQTTTVQEDSSEVFKVYETEIGLITPTIRDAVNTYLDTLKLPPDWIIEAIQIAGQHNKRNWAYCAAILKRWAVEGKNATSKTRKYQSSNRKQTKGEHPSPIVLPDQTLESLRERARKELLPL